MDGEVDHYGIVVSEMDRSLEFYTERLGLDHFDTIDQEDPAFSTAVDIEGTHVELAFLDGGDSVIELVDFHEPAGDNANEGIDLNDTGAAHLCLGVEDVDAAYEDLEGAATFLSEPQDLETGVSLAFLTDPDGNVIELLEE